jgi:pyruvate formate lyase activating enzyme
MACTTYCPGDAREGYGKAWSLEDLLQTLLRDRSFYKFSGGGVTISGGECLAQPEFAVALAKALYEEGISVDVDTCGCVRREIFERIAPYTDTFLYDIKAIDPEVHKRCTARDNSLILENLKYLCESGCRVEIRYPYVPGMNDGEAEKIADFIKELKSVKCVCVLPYHNYAASKYKALGMAHTLPEQLPTDEEIEHAKAFFER